MLALEAYVRMNMVVTFLVLAIMLGLYLSASSGHGPNAILYKSHPATASAFWLMFVTFASFFISYGTQFLHDEAMKSLPQGKIFIDPCYHVAEAVVGNLASVCTLSAAIAYARGSAFNLGTAIRWIAVSLLAIFLWATVFENVDDSAFSTALKMSPDVIVSAIAGVALGWVFFVRWGGLNGALVLIVSVAYSVLQLPAYLSIGGIGALIPQSNLNLAFPCLAGGKLLLAFGILSLLCGSTAGALAMHEPKYWPTGAVPPPSWMQTFYGWIGSFVSSVAVAISTEPLKAIMLKVFG